MKKPEDPVGQKLFQLAELALDDALGSTDAEVRLETLKAVSTLYIGHTRATKNIPPSDENALTFDKLIEKVNSIQETK